MKVKFPDQIPLLKYTREQIEALSSIPCGEVFQSLMSSEAHSIREVADDLSKSPAAVGEHVATLFDVGLIIKAGTRKRRSRIEQLYVHKGVESHMIVDEHDWEAIEVFLRRFRGSMRMAVRQNEAYHRARMLDETITLFHQYEWTIVYMSAENSIKMKKALAEMHVLMNSLSESDPDKRTDGRHVRVKMSTLMFPSVPESQKIIDENEGE